MPEWQDRKIGSDLALDDRVIGFTPLAVDGGKGVLHRGVGARIAPERIVDAGRRQLAAGEIPGIVGIIAQYPPGVVSELISSACENAVCGGRSVDTSRWDTA